jgi:hypothetical protein
MLLPQGAEGQELAEREWILEAEKLVDMFRETRNLFRTSRVSITTLATIAIFERTLFLRYLEQPIPRDATEESETIGKNH